MQYTPKNIHLTLSMVFNLITNGSPFCYTIYGKLHLMFAGTSIVSVILELNSFKVSKTLKIDIRCNDCIALPSKSDFSMLSQD